MYANTDKLFSLKNYHDLAVAGFMWKLHNDQHPISIKMMFTEKVNNVLTRSNTRFQLPSCKTESKRRFITFSGLKLWNTVPPEIKSCKSIEIFTKKMKSYIKSRC